MDSRGATRTAAPSTVGLIASVASNLKISLKIRGHTRVVEVLNSDGRMSFAVDACPVDADWTAIAPGLYSILLSGRSFEAHIKEAPHGDLIVTIEGHDFVFTIDDPRQWRRRGAAFEAEGKQQVIASMPGKVVQLLVSVGDAVRAGQGLAVIEAMKMQNEVRSPRSGTVERLLVAPGQAVNAGEILAVVG
jgi:biotin carboxyl carrier protein